MTEGGKGVLFAPGRVVVTPAPVRGIRASIPPTRTPPPQAHSGRGRGRGLTIQELRTFTTALAAVSAGSGKVVPSTPEVPAALVLLSSTTLASPAKFDISALSSAYSDLLCVCICRATSSGTNDALIMQLNGDTGASNYSYQQLTVGSTSVTASAGVLTGNIRLAGAIPANAGTANRFAVVEFTIGGYTSTAFHKQVIARSGSSDNDTAAQQFTEAFAGTWLSTAAVNRIQLQCSGGTGSLATGSQLRIYGRS